MSNHSLATIGHSGLVLQLTARDSTQHYGTGILRQNKQTATFQSLTEERKNSHISKSR